MWGSTNPTEGLKMNSGWGEETNDKGEVTMVNHPDEVWVRFGFPKKLTVEKSKTSMTHR